MGRFRKYFVGAGIGVTLVLYLIAAYGAAQVGRGLWDGTNAGYEQAEAERATLAGTLGTDSSLEAGLDNPRGGPLDALRSREEPHLDRLSSPAQPAAQDHPAES